MKKYTFYQEEVFPLRSGGYEFGGGDAIEGDTETIADMKRGFKMDGLSFIKRTKINGRDTFVFFDTTYNYFLGVFIKQ